MTLSIDSRANLWPDRTAVVDHGVDHNYADLADRADRTARRLAARGVGEGDAVAILARNRIEHLGLLFACRRLGATLAPISHRLGAEPVDSLGERIDPALVLYEERFEGLAEAAGDDLKLLEDFADTDPVGDDELQSDPGAVPPDATEETPLLYLHTGGTTGVPKVVVVTRRQVEWNCITEAAAWGLGEDDVAPIVLPMYHTGGWLLLTLPLLYVGGRIILHREFEPRPVLAAIENHGATRLFGVAAVFSAMADHDDFPVTDLSSLKWCMSGGGPTPESVIETYRDRGVVFVQGYGLTEGGPNNLYFPPDRAAEDKVTESVGRPFPDCEARLVDPDSGDVLERSRDQAVTGELELRGPVTARRYLETEDGTFGCGPSSEASGTSDDRQSSGEWVSTGDIARRDADGDYVIVGRTDNMFVSGGENVYPENIEEVLERHPNVAAAGVVGIPHDRWGTVPKAVVAPASGEDVDTDDLEGFFRERLADFEVPKAWAVADELPRSGPGKLDREALEDRFGGDGGSTGGGPG